MRQIEINGCKVRLRQLRHFSSTLSIYLLRAIAYSCLVSSNKLLSLLCSRLDCTKTDALSFQHLLGHRRRSWMHISNFNLCIFISIYFQPLL